MQHILLVTFPFFALVLCGEQDPVTPVADHAAIADAIAGARFERVADCGHLSTIERPDAVTKILVDWLAQGE